MVDVIRRKKLAEHLRHLSVGLITNDEFEDIIGDDVSYGWLPEQYSRSKEAKFDDPVIEPILVLSWGLYNDTKCHKLTKQYKLSEEALEIIARCILFLQSNREYEWPEFEYQSTLFNMSFAEIVKSILSLGEYYREKRKEQYQAYDAYQKLGSYELWPFFNEKDYEQQLMRPPFLIS